MKWHDNGIILSQRPYSENKLILNVLTENHGRHSGVIRLNKTKQHSSSIQPGNFIEANWNARLSEHLGRWDMEVKLMPWVHLLNRSQPLLALSTACTLIDICLPERHPYPNFYLVLSDFLDLLVKNSEWPKHYILFEIKLLAAMGFGLTLNFCAVTKTTQNLKFVSPKTGHAVCEEVGKPYAERLFHLPAFLIDETLEPTPQDVIQALNLTGYFLSHFLLEDKELPKIRQRLVSSLSVSSLTNFITPKKAIG